MKSNHCSQICFVVVMISSLAFPYIKGEIAPNQIFSFALRDYNLNLSDTDGDGFNDQVEVSFLVLYEGISSGSYSINVTLWAGNKDVESFVFTHQVTGLTPDYDSYQFAAVLYQDNFLITFDLVYNNFFDHRWETTQFWLDGYNEEVPYIKEISEIEVNGDDDVGSDGIDYHLTIFYNESISTEVEIFTYLFDSNNETIFEKRNSYTILGNQSNAIIQVSGRAPSDGYYHTEVELLWQGVVRQSFIGNETLLDRFYSLTTVKIFNLSLVFGSLNEDQIPETVSLDYYVEIENSIDLTITSELHSENNSLIQSTIEKTTLTESQNDQPFTIHYSTVTDAGNYTIYASFEYEGFVLFEWNSESLFLNAVPTNDFYLTSIEVDQIDTDMDGEFDSIKVHLVVSSDGSYDVIFEMGLSNYNASYNEIDQHEEQVSLGISSYSYIFDPVPNEDIYYIEFRLIIDGFTLDSMQFLDFVLKPLGYGFGTEPDRSLIISIDLNFTMISLIFTVVLYRNKKNSRSNFK